MCFSPQWLSLYLVTEFSGRLPRSAVRGLNAVIFSYSHFTLSANLHSLFFFHYNAFGDTSPIFLASAKKPLSAKHVLICNSSWQLSNNRTSSEAQHIQSFFWHTLPPLSTFRAKQIGHPHFDDVSHLCLFLKMCISTFLYIKRGAE